MPKLLVPESLEWDLTGLPIPVARLGAHNALSEQDRDADAILLWGVGRGPLARLVPELPNLKWVQAMSAGVDHITSLDLPEQVVVSNGRGLHDIPVAEHSAALLLMGVRGLHLLRDAQAGGKWAQGDYWAQTRAGNGATRPTLGTLEDALVLVLGMGSIGVAIGRALLPFGARVEGIAQTAGERSGFVTHALADLDRLLPEADALVLVLPETPATRGILSRERLALLPAHAWVVNVGRGSAIDEEALADALESGTIGGAALDVFDREPLPAESRLWGQPNAIISPHVAGGGPHFARKARELLYENARRYTAGERLLNTVDRDRGY